MDGQKAHLNVEKHGDIKMLIAVLVLKTVNFRKIEKSGENRQEIVHGIKDRGWESCLSGQICLFEVERSKCQVVSQRVNQKFEAFKITNGMVKAN